METRRFYDIDEMQIVSISALKKEHRFIEPEISFAEYLHNAMFENGGNLVPYTGQKILDPVFMTSAYPQYLPIPTK